MKDTREILLDGTEVLTKDEFIRILIQAHDLALYLLSLRWKVAPKTIKDQLEFTEKIFEATESDFDTFSLEDVSAILLDNAWLEIYLRLAPQLDFLLEDDESFGNYNA